MKLEDLELLADNAIARWQNGDLPKLSGVASFKIVSPSKMDELFGVKATYLGRCQGGFVYLIDAFQFKKALARFRLEF